MMAEELRPLAGPYELFDLADGEVMRLLIYGWERGSMVIHPKFPGAPSVKTIQALRVLVPTDVKATYPHYYDITSKTLIAQLLPFLMEANYKEFSYTITKIGVAPRARFTLLREPYP